MNKARRKQLAELASELEAIGTALEALRDEEQDYYDNMPESLQDGERGQKAYDAIDAIDNAVNGVAETLDYINEAVEC